MRKQGKNWLRLQRKKTSNKKPNDPKNPCTRKTSMKSRNEQDDAQFEATLFDYLI